jgi:hypothetical protein
MEINTKTDEGVDDSTPFGIRLKKPSKEMVDHLN